MSQMIDPSHRIYAHPITGRTVVETVNLEPSLTDQSGQRESDINYIMAKYEKTGLITHMAKNQGKFMDVSNVPDYQTMLAQIQEAESAFMTLPATTRLKFQNDPGQLISFLQDEKNRDEAIKLGLVNPPPPPSEQLQTPTTQTQTQTPSKT